jgi:hypothetical protein
MSRASVVHGVDLGRRLGSWFRASWPAVLVVGVSLPYNIAVASLAAFEIADEGYLVYIAEALHAGLRPYRDVELLNYPPGLFYLVGDLLALGGDSGVLLVRLAMAAALSAASLMTYLTLRPVVGRGLAIGCALIVGLTPGPFYKAYVRLLEVGLLWAWTRQALSPRRGYWLAAALLTGVSFALRLDAAYAGVLLGFLVGWGQLGSQTKVTGLSRLLARPLLFGLVVVTTLVPLVVRLADAEALGSYVRQVVGLLSGNAQRVVSAPTIALPGLGSLFTLSAPAVFACSFWGAVATTLAAVVDGTRAAIMARRSRDADELSRGQALLRGVVLLWLLLNLPQWAMMRPDLYHLTQQAFAIAVACTLLIADGWRRLARAAPWLSRLGGAAGCALGGATVIVLVGGLGILGPRWSLAAALSPTLLERLGNGVGFRGVPGDRGRELLEVVSGASDLGESVLSLPFLPGVNYLTRRPMPIPQVHILPGSTDAVGRADLMQSLAESSPALVVYARDYTTTGDLDGTLRVWAPELDRYFMEGFRPIMEVAGRLLLANPTRPLSADLSTPLLREGQAAALVARARMALRSRRVGDATAELARAARLCGDSVVVMMAVAEAADFRHDLTAAYLAYDWVVARATLAAPSAHAANEEELPALRAEAQALVPEPMIVTCPLP